MKEELKSKIEEIVETIESKYNIELEFDLPVDKSSKIFAISGNKTQMKEIDCDFTALFDQLNIHHVGEFYFSFNDSENETLMHMYEWK